MARPMFDQPRCSSNVGTQGSDLGDAASPQRSFQPEIEFGGSDPIRRIGPELPTLGIVAEIVAVKIEFGPHSVPSAPVFGQNSS